MATASVIYRDGLFRLSVPMTGTTSNPINCNTLSDFSLEIGQQLRGSSTPVGIILPPTWVTSDLYFNSFLDDTFTIPLDLTIGNVTNDGYLIANANPNSHIPLYTPLFSGIKYFKVQSTVAQPAQNLTIILFPLEQVFK